MRLLVLSAVAALPAGSAAAPAPIFQPAPEAAPVASANPAASADKCRRPDFRQAERGGSTQFRRLDELPNATAYMAVYRTVDGCEIPMTVTEYRTGRR